MFRKIIVPIDVDDMGLAEPAMKRAIALAKAGKSELRLIFVARQMAYSFQDFIPPRMEVKAEQIAREKLEAYASRLDLPASSVSIVTHVGAVYDEVLKEARKWGADLVLIGSHHPSMSTYLLGSNAAAIARHADCSVLIVRD